MSGNLIERVRARQILDSRAAATIEVEITTKTASARVAAPSGKSRGKYEAVPFPTGGVKQAVEVVRGPLAKKLIGVDVSQQQQIDAILHEFDGTPRFKEIGGNTAYSISVAAAKTAAELKGRWLYENFTEYLGPVLPLLLGNVIGGGLHATGLATDVQEILVTPLNASSFFEAIETNVAAHAEIARTALKVSGRPLGRGDEGGWVLPLRTEEALRIARKACTVVTRRSGVKIGLGVDFAASVLWNEKKQRYVYRRDKKERDTQKQIEYVRRIVKEYKLLYVEDPFREEDFEAYSELLKDGKNTLVCGDDLVVTRLERLNLALQKRAINCVVIKPNQVGTLTDTVRTVSRAQKNGVKCVMSHRSGETFGTEISHLAVGLGCQLLKSGVLGGERVEKINELMQIIDRENEKGCDLKFPELLD